MNGYSVAAPVVDHHHQHQTPISNGYAVDNHQHQQQAVDGYAVGHDFHQKRNTGIFCENYVLFGQRWSIYDKSQTKNSLSTHPI